VTSNYIKVSLLIFLCTLVQPFALAEQSASSWPSLTNHVLLPPDGQRADAFHVVVIGDSIAWGNGLNDQDKYYYLVADWLQKELNRPVDVAVYAHSGASISGETGKSIDPNLNNGYPSLIDQANSIQNKGEVDLILVSGGINDVKIENILNPQLSPDDIYQRALSIKDPMENLLSYLLSECKNAKIVVTDYYPIVSEDSDAKFILGLYGVFEFLINDPLEKLDAFELKESLIDNSLEFHEGSTTAITNAALEADNAANRIVPANVDFKPANSYAASETWLWKLIGPEVSMEAPLELDLDVLKTDDDQFDYRSSLASDAIPFESIDDYINKINAIGHPNRNGAREYARAIESTIKSKGLDWLQNENAIIQETNSTQESSQQVSSTTSVSSVNQPRISWIRKNHFYTGIAETSSIQQTSDGGYIIASSHDEDDIRLAKTDANGNPIWDMKLEGPEEENIGRSGEIPFSVLQMSDEGYNILGSSSDVNGIFAWLFKTDSKGNIFWSKTVEEQNKIIGGRQTNDGGYIVATISSNGNIELGKIDSEGTKIWNKTFEGATFGDSPDYDKVKLPIQQTEDGGYVIACHGNNASLLLKTDDKGNELWQKIFTQPGPLMDFAYSVQETSDGGYIVAGVEIKEERDSNNNVKEYWYGALIRTDPSGNVVWNKTYDMYEDSNDKKWTDIESALQTEDGGYILAGTADDRLWITKTDSSGNKEWDNAFQLFASTPWSISSILQTSDGGFLIGGDSNSWGPWLVKIGGNEYVNGTENDPIPKTEKMDAQEVNAESVSEKNQSSMQGREMTSETPGFGGILAIAALLCILIVSRKD